MSFVEVLFKILTHKVIILKNTFTDDIISLIISKKTTDYLHYKTLSIKCLYINVNLLVKNQLEALFLKQLRNIESKCVRDNFCYIVIPFDKIKKNNITIKELLLKAEYEEYKGLVRDENMKTISIEYKFIKKL